MMNGTISLPEPCSLAPRFKLQGIKVFVVVVSTLVLLARSAGAATDFEEPESVDGLTVHREANGVVLTWPSHPREKFVVLWRPEKTIEAVWIELTNQMSAAAMTNLTVFRDTDAFTRAPAMLTNENLADFYRVFVIPDFWFDMDGVELRGGPNCGEDFLPFYTGSKESGTLFEPHVSVLVNGEEFCTDGSELDFDTEKSIELVNFGTGKRPYWAHARGFWFWHDTLPNGEYTLQLKTVLRLNLYIGDSGQELILTNKPVRVRVNNKISFAGWQPFIQGDTYTFVARSALSCVHWRIDVYDLKGEKVISKTGRTTNGEIRWVWDLRDKHGRLRADFGPDPGFRCSLTIWPSRQPLTHFLFQFRCKCLAHNRLRRFWISSKWLHRSKLHAQ